MGRQSKNEADELAEDEYEEEYEEGEESPGGIGRISPARRKFIVVLLILLLFGGASHGLWKQYQQEVMQHHTYHLTPEQISYTPPPEWLAQRRDIRQDVVRYGSLESSNISDVGLTPHVASAFLAHPWIKDVVRARKQHGAKVECVVEYRIPVAMVGLPDEAPDDPKNKTYSLPIDAEGVWLPPDLDSEFAFQLPRIDLREAFREPNTDIPGHSWGDPTVTAAAKLAEFLSPDWDTLRKVLWQIEVSSRATSLPQAVEFDIRGQPDLGPDPPGLLIHWGRAPGNELAGEPTAKAKLASLQAWLKTVELAGRRPQGEIDLRSTRTLQLLR